MTTKTRIDTDKAPKAIGSYSQAIKSGNQVFLSGQIPLDPKNMQLISENFQEQVEQVFKNLQAVCEAAGGSLDDIVKLNIYLTDLSNFSRCNETMEGFFAQPYPARAAVGVKELPRGALIEADAIMMLSL